jgi:hypothetical protein
MSEPLADQSAIQMVQPIAEAGVIEQQTNAVVEQIPGVDKVALHMVNDVLTFAFGTGAPIGLVWSGVRLAQDHGSVTLGENALASFTYAATQPLWQSTCAQIFDRLLGRLEGTPNQIDWYRNVFGNALKIIADGGILGACLYAAGQIGGTDAPLAQSTVALTGAFALIGLINFVVDATVLKHTYQVKEPQRAWANVLSDWMEENKTSVTTLKGLLDRATQFSAFTTYTGTNTALKLIWLRAGVSEKYAAAFSIIDMIAFFGEFKAWQELLVFIAVMMKKMLRAFGVTLADHEE